ncbi:MAG: MFS transporter [Betaproteobacteria bacterium]|nr:MFS transporter [Betaproteobacteria bacterium]MBI2226770.1 MFS transporter [Betaproteobacteria bacterium]
MLKRAPQSDVAWLTELCLSRIGFVSIFTTYSAALPLLKADWNMSASQAGMVQSAWHVGYLVSLFAIGFVTDRHGAKRTFLAGSILASISALAFAFFADSFASGLLLYGLTGMCSGASYTPGLTLISERFVAHQRGRAMGWYLATASLGYGISLTLSGLLMPYIGWRGAFIVTACGPLAGALISFWALRATPNVVHARGAGHTGGFALLEVWRNKPAMLLIWAYVFHSWELLGMWAWLPAYLAVSVTQGGSMTAQAAGIGAMLTALTYITSMGGSIYGGAFSDRWGRTRVILLGSCLSLVCSFAFGWMMALPLWLLVAVAAFYNITAIADSSVYSTAITELVPPQFLGAAFALRSLLGFGAGVISPWVFGLVIDWARGEPLRSESMAWGLAWTSLGIGAVLGPLMTLKLRHMPEAAKMAGGLR